MSTDELVQELNKILNEESLQEKAVMSRVLLQKAIEHIYENEKKELPKKATMLELIDGPVVSGYIDDPDIQNSLHYVRILGMNAGHGRKVRKKEARLTVQNISHFIDFIQAKENGDTSFGKAPYMSELETRRLYVDLYLREAGWDVLDEENVVVPAKAGIEIEVQGMPNPHGVGFCDYALFGRNGEPLAVVEVKKTSVSAEKGRHQVDLYGECMRRKYGYRPVLYYTNGYVTKVIDGLYPDRTVMAYHTMGELELLIQRRSRSAVTDITIDDNITNRPYQKIAVTKICERLNSRHRRGLLVMATGTGKTRVSISIVDVLIRNHWLKTLLFLADRTTLVQQAKENYEKLLPGQPMCDLSASGKKDYNARFIFCTYQKMIRYIDAEDKRFSSGRFDLIIIDEAHRSIFNRYGSIFAYFDSLLIGLTATPKNEVDANTYRIFDCEAGLPTDDYPMEDAIRDEYLVGYKVINRVSELLSQGIQYDKLTGDEKKQLEGYLQGKVPSPDFSIPSNDFFNILYNENTCNQVLEELMTMGLKVDHGENIGKTIIFAYNHKHAQMIVECFHALYPAYPDNYCQLVDNYVKYADDLVRKFKEDPGFRIAVSVDMLDTGVDVPEVLNLVFFKKIHSKIKFIQMIGRGTRLCENLFGSGQKKTMFLIFDYLQNFKYFKMHPDEAEGKTHISLSQRAFQIKLDILYELQALDYQMDAWLRNYYKQTKAGLMHTVKGIRAQSSRIQVRQEMETLDRYCDANQWVSLSPVNVQEIKIHISPLLDSGLGGDPEAVAFDCRMYNIEYALLKEKSIRSARGDVKVVKEIAEFLIDQRASVPQVLAKASDLKKIVQDSFWDDPTVVEIEQLRESLRDLMRFLKGNQEYKFDVDIHDTFSNDDFNAEETDIDIRTYKQKVLDYLVEHSDNATIRKIHNLEPINNDDLKELERILWTELGTREEYNHTTDQPNLAAFVRSLIGLSQEAVNEKFGEYLSGNKFNSQQQEFIQMIIDYVRENGDISLSDMVNSEPFSNFDLMGMFGKDIVVVKKIVNTLHDSVEVAA